MVIELVVPIIKGVIHFLIQRIAFSYRVHGKIWPNLLTRGFSAMSVTCDANHMKCETLM